RIVDDLVTRKALDARRRGGLFEDDAGEAALLRPQRRAEPGGTGSDDDDVDRRSRRPAAGAERLGDVVDRAGALVDRARDQRQAGQVPRDVQPGDVAALEVVGRRGAAVERIAFVDPEAAVRADLLAQDDAAALVRPRDHRDVFVDREDVERTRVDAGV